MPCKIDHGPEGLPQCLCRVCHPELVPTEAQRQEWVIRVRAAQDRTSINQELLRTRQKVASMSRDGEPDPCCVPVKARIYRSLQRKQERLEQQLQRADAANPAVNNL